VRDVVVSTALDPLMSIKALAKYSSLSPRRLRMYLDAAPNDALACYRVGSRVLVRRSMFDAWLERYSSRGRLTNRSSCD